MIQHCGGQVLCTFTTTALTKDMPLNGWRGVWLVILLMLPCAIIVCVVAFCACHSASRAQPSHNHSIVPPVEVRGGDIEHELDRPVEAPERRRSYRVSEEDSSKIAHTVIPVFGVEYDGNIPSPGAASDQGLLMSDIENQSI
jgi:hypothetical protein